MGIPVDCARNFIQALCGLIKIAGTYEVVPFENRARFVPRHHHSRNALADPGANEISDCRAAAKYTGS